MRAVVQRVTWAEVEVDRQVVARLGRGGLPAPGLLALVGVGRADVEGDAIALGDKLVGLRVFSDSLGRMNLSVGEVGGGITVVSQFTLYGDVRRGRRPSFLDAAPPERAAPLCDRVVARLRERGVPTATGVFRSHMAVRLENDGPVTLVVEGPVG
jgi:D-tyrosyl-tRNA(Tyr) deacylase